jgi:hypothetical protein
MRLQGCRYPFPFVLSLSKEPVLSLSKGSSHAQGFDRLSPNGFGAGASDHPEPVQGI